MNDSKEILQSKTVWAALITAIVTVLQILNIVSITSEEQNVITMGILASIQLIGACAAIYGRVVAKHKIDTPK